MKEYDSFEHIFKDVKERYITAKAKHPEFAWGKYEALGYLGEEFGEVTKEITKQHEGWQDRMQSELLDLIVVSCRILLKHYDHGEDF